MISGPRCFGSPTWGMGTLLGDSGGVDVAPWPMFPALPHECGMPGEGSQPSL